MIDARLVPAAIAAWLSAGLLIGLPGAAPVAAASSLGVAGVLAVLARRKGGQLLLAGLLVLAATGALALAVALAAPGRQPAELTSLGERSGTALVALSEPGGESLGGSYAKCVLLRFDAGGKSLDGMRIPVLVLWNGDERNRDVPLGSRFVVEGRLVPTELGGGVAYLLRAGSAGRVDAPPPLALSWAEDLRTGFRELASATPGTGGELLPGLAIGDDSGVGTATSDAMKESSLSHLTAVSGANCAVVVAVVLLLARALGLRRVPRILLALLALAAFVVLVTPQPSVLRAAVMSAVVLVATVAGRPSAGLPTLCVAVILLLALDPWLAREYGFALSVLATAGLLVLAGPLTALLARAVPIPLAAVLSVPVAAQLACQPVLLLLDPTIGLYSVPANLLAAPAAPIATLAGLAACLLHPLIPAVSTALAWLAWLPASWIGAVAEFFADAPGGRLPWPAGGAGLVLLAVPTVAFAVALLRRRTRLLAILAVAAGVLVCGVLGGRALGRSAALPSDWQIAACDVGQGDAGVVRSGDQVALIDTGDDPQALRECLDLLGVSRIRLLVLTHFDRDHVGAYAEVAGMVDEVFVGPSDGAAADRIAAELAASGAHVEAPRIGTTGVLGRLRWQVLWPPERSVEPGNDASVVLEFAGEGIRSVFLGDLGEEAQRALARSTDLSRVDVVKVAHHGSADQSASVYAELAPRAALISAGLGNDYGHPTSRLLEILREEGALPLRTDLQGTVVLGPGSDGLRVWAEHAALSDPATTVGERR